MEQKHLQRWLRLLCAFGAGVTGLFLLIDLLIWKYAVTNPSFLEPKDFVLGLLTVANGAGLLCLLFLVSSHRKQIATKRLCSALDRTLILVLMGNIVMTALYVGSLWVL